MSRPKTKTPPAGITASITTWANSLGMDHSGLVQKLVRAEIEFERGAPISAWQVYQAVTFRSEKDSAIARQANAKAEEQEMENLERRKELMNVAQIEKLIWNDCLSPLRTEIEQMPKSLCSMCNPEEPDVAQKVLETWVEKVKLNIKEKRK